MKQDTITVETTIHAPIQTVWDLFTQPAHVTAWNHASPDWECPRARNDLRIGGTFCYTMAAKDGSVSFDFEGTYDAVNQYHSIEYHMTDGRHVTITFTDTPQGTTLTETFDPETQNPISMQHEGWQAILNNFKAYVESHKP